MSDAEPVTDLVVSTFTPTVNRGRSMRTYGVIAALARDRRVEILYKPFGDVEPSPHYARLSGVSLTPVASAGGSARALLYARARLAGVPPADARGLSPELAVASARAAGAGRAGRIIADGPTAGALLQRSELEFVYLAHNVESVLRPTLPQFRREYGSVRALRRFERSLLGSASESWMASRRDVDLARRLAPRASLRYVPNVVDVAAIAAANGPRPAAALFVGDFSYPPNVNALRFLTDEVMPRVWASLPDAELVVAGHGLTLPTGRDPRIRALGYVDRIDDAYAQASCVVVPLLEGGGSPLKFVEALAHGLPIVATGLAAAGLDVQDGVHYRRGDGAPGFAAALVTVMRDGAWELAANGRRLAEQAYSIDALAAILGR